MATPYLIAQLADSCFAVNGSVSFKPRDERTASDGDSCRSCGCGESEFNATQQVPQEVAIATFRTGLVGLSHAANELSDDTSA
jgi:hypothetical protein